MTEEDKQEVKDIRIGLWKRTSKKGLNYLAGSTERHWVAYFNNQRQEGERPPAGYLKFTPKDEHKGQVPEINAGLFRRVSKKGNEYLGGVHNGKRFAIFPNQFKKSDKQPDYTVLISLEEEKPVSLEVAPQQVTADSLNEEDII